MRLVLATLLTTLPAAAFAHGGDPAVAYFTSPTGVGNVVDSSIDITWVDADRSIPTGTATVDFFYTNRQPPTFQSGERPDDLVGEVVVTGIPEKDMPNAYTWDTSAVPAGSYVLWSQVVEPPEENMSIQIIDLSPGIVTVAHPGDPVYPAVLLTAPNSPFKYADESFEITWEAFDPDGTARIRIEARIGPTGTPIVVADDLPATAEGSVVWDTSNLEENDWILEAIITDDRGLSFRHFSRYVVLVTHQVGPRDGGVAVDASAADAGVAIDGGKIAKVDEGCDCATSSGAASGWWSLLGLYAVLRRRVSR